MSELHFDITADNDNIISVVDDTIKQMEELANTAKSLSQSFDMSTPEEAIKSLGSAIEGNEQVINDYKTKLEELAQKQQEAALTGDVDSVRAYGQEMSELAIRMQDTILETNSLKEAVAATSEEMENNDGIMIKLLGGQEKYNAIISQLPPGLKATVQGLNGMVGAARAFIATPLGAVLAALILAYKAISTWLKGTAEGQQKLAKISGYLKGVLAGLKQIVFDVGKALYNAFSSPKDAIKNFVNFIKDQIVVRVQALGGLFTNLGKIIKHTFTFQFDDVKDDLKEFGKAVVEFETGVKTEKLVAGAKGISDRVKGIQAIGKAQADLSARENKLHRDRTAWMNEEAEIDKQIAEERNKMRIGSAAERKEAATRMQDLINKKTEQQVAFAKEEYEIKKASNALTDSSQEDLDEEERLRARVVQLETQGITAKGMALRIQNSMNRSLGQSAEKLKEVEERRKELSESIGETTETLEKEAAKLKVAGMKEGFEKERAELDSEQKDRRDVLKKSFDSQKKQIENLQKNLYKTKHGGSLTGFAFDENDELFKQASDNYSKGLENLAAQEQLENDAFNKKMEESRTANRLEYLQQYGSYKEQELAITEKYDKQILDTEDEYAKKLLQKKKEQELEALRRQSDASYALIFANADILSDNLLKRAIEVTQEEIRKATESGDIQKLTELYAASRKQLTEKSSRSEWGFIGLGKAFSEIRKAVEEAENAATGEERDRALANLQAAMSKVHSKSKQIQSVFSSIGSLLKGFDGTLAEIGDAVSSLGDSVGDVMEIASSNKAGQFSKSDAYSTIITSVINLMMLVGGQIKANKEAQKEWNRTIEQSAQEMRMLNIEGLKYRQSNIFGVEDPFKKATDSANMYGEAVKSLIEVNKQFANAQIQTGQKYALNGANALKGAGIGAAGGAAVGSIIPVIGTTIGALIGAAVGALAGALSGKMVPVMSDLASQFDYIYDKDFELNPEIIAQYDKLDEDTKQIVDNWDKIKQKAKEAQEELRSNLSSFTSDLGKELEDMLVDAWTSGRVYGAVDEYKKYVGSKIAEILKERAFSTVFEGLFNRIGDAMEDSFLGKNADYDITDELKDLSESVPTLFDAYGQMMAQMDEQMQSLGFGSLSNGLKETNASASQGSFQTISETTGQALEGRFTAIQITTQLIAERFGQSLILFETMGNYAISSNTMLSEIRDAHIREMSYLADIATQTRPIEAMNETISRIDRTLRNM